MTTENAYAWQIKETNENMIWVSINNTWTQVPVNPNGSVDVPIGNGYKMRVEDVRNYE